MKIQTWLPLVGRMLAPGRGDPAEPIDLLPIHELIALLGAPPIPPEGLTVRAIEFDWDNGQALVEIETTQAWLDWLNSQDIAERDLPLTAQECADLLSKANQARQVFNQRQLARPAEERAALRPNLTEMERGQ